MKICTICNQRPVRSGVRTSYCAKCNRAYGRENYQQNKGRYFAQAKKRDKDLDELINQYKSKPCADCGVQYPPYVMDFDHLPEHKKFLGISAMRRRRMAFDRIVSEIEKCEVVCANCHRVRTFTRNPTRYSRDT